MHSLLLYRNQSSFHSFVSGITAGGGDDGPEDIMGGLKVAFSSLSWRPGGCRVCTAVIIRLCTCSDSKDESI